MEIRFFIFLTEVGKFGKRDRMVLICAFHLDQPLNLTPLRVVVPHALDLLADVAARQSFADTTVRTAGRPEDIGI